MVFLVVSQRSFLCRVIYWSRHLDKFIGDPDCRGPSLLVQISSGIQYLDMDWVCAPKPRKAVPKSEAIFEVAPKKSVKYLEWHPWGPLQSGRRPIANTPRIVANAQSPIETTSQSSKKVPNHRIQCSVPQCRSGLCFLDTCTFHAGVSPSLRLLKRF